MDKIDIAATAVAAAAMIRYPHRRIHIVVAYAAFLHRDTIADLITKN